MHKDCGVALRLFEPGLESSRIESEAVEFEGAPRTRSCSLVSVEDRESWGKNSYHDSSSCGTQIVTDEFDTSDTKQLWSI
jgi:hypothetical protein